MNLVKVKSIEKQRCYQQGLMQADKRYLTRNQVSTIIDLINWELTSYRLNSIYINQLTRLRDKVERINGVKLSKKEKTFIAHLTECILITKSQKISREEAEELDKFCFDLTGRHILKYYIFWKDLENKRESDKYCPFCGHKLRR